MKSSVLSTCPGVRPGEDANHGEAVALRDSGGFHGGAGTDLSEALRLPDPVTEPGDALRQEGSAVCAAKHRQAHGGAAAGRQLRHKVMTA